MPERRVLLKCQHGSHLYGMATPNSDLDFYVVYEFPWKIYRPHKQSHQKIDLDEETDTMSASLERFTHLCLKGVPQTLEALFSDVSQWLEYHESWYYKSDNLKRLVGQHIPSVLETYKRTAWSIFEKDDFKKNRHALRLCLNAKDLKTIGSFDPTLKPDVREEITRIANLPRRQREEIFKDVFYETFGDL